MGGKVEKHHIGGTAMFLFCLSLTILAISGWALNREFDGAGIGKVNAATQAVLFFSLIAGLATAAAAIAGLFHVRLFKAGSLAAASSLSLLAWLFSILALGFASKQIDLGGTGDKLTALAVLDIVMAAFLTLYVLLLHDGLFGSGYGAGY